jgi:hypothetical protein
VVDPRIIPIPHSDWNAVVEEFRRNRPLICGSRTGGGWQHPWYPNLEWDDLLQTWRVTIKPGFVNGREIEVSVRELEAPPVTVARAESDSSIRIGANILARLSEEPAISVRRWRSIGPDAEPIGAVTNPTSLSARITFESVHPFFLSLGVGVAPQRTISMTGGINEVQRHDSADDRLLRAAEVVLRVPRPATTAQWIFGDPASGSVAEFNVNYAGSVATDRAPQITVEPEFNPDPESDPVQRLLGNWQDSGRDELHIATIYLVSPPGADLGSAPDATWESYYQGHVFWNVNHGHKILPVLDQPSLRYVAPALALSSASTILASLVSPLNDLYDAALEFVRNRTLDGRFWTT